MSTLLSSGWKRLFLRAVMVVIAITIAGVWASNYLFSRVIPTAGLARTTSMDVVAIALIGNATSGNTPAVRLKVPKAYMTDPGNWYGGDQETLHLETGLPDLKPRPANAYPSAPVGWPDHEAQVRYWLDGFVLEMKLAPEKKDYLDQSWKRVNGNIRDRAGYVERPAVFGLRRVHAVPCMRKDIVESKEAGGSNGSNCDPDRPMEEFFFAFDPAGRVEVAFRCEPPYTGIQSGCFARFLHRNIEVQTVFRRSELARWSDFVGGAKRLVDKFAISVS